MNARTLFLTWVRQYTRGRPSDASVTIPVSELLGLEEQLRDAPSGNGRVNHRKPKGMTSRSKQRKRPDTEYLAFVRNHPCCSCGDPRDTEAHHTGRKGMGQKAPDVSAVPLCRACHQFFHDEGRFCWKSREETLVLVEKTIKALQSEWAERQSKETF